jgi:hypothetical protein
MLRGAVPATRWTKAVTEMRRSAETDDVPLMGTSSSAFHRLVVNASENRRPERGRCAGLPPARRLGLDQNWCSPPSMSRFAP